MNENHVTNRPPKKALPVHLNNHALIHASVGSVFRLQPNMDTEEKTDKNSISLKKKNKQKKIVECLG